MKLIVKGVEGTGEAGSRVTSRDTAGLSWEGTLRWALGSAVEVEERGCPHSPARRRPHGAKLPHEVGSMDLGRHCPSAGCQETCGLPAQ